MVFFSAPLSCPFVLWFGVFGGELPLLATEEHDWAPTPRTAGRNVEKHLALPVAARSLTCEALGSKVSKASKVSKVVTFLTFCDADPNSSTR